MRTTSAAGARLARSPRAAAAGPEAEPHGAPDVPRSAEAPADWPASAAGRDRAVRPHPACPAWAPGERRPAAALIRGLPAESGARHPGAGREGRPAAASAAEATARPPGTAALSPDPAAAARLLSCRLDLAAPDCSEREPGAEAYPAPEQGPVSACWSRSAAPASALVEGRSAAPERQQEQGPREARSRAGCSWGRAAGASPPRRAPGSVPAA